MGGLLSKPVPEGTYSANAPGEVTPFTIRRHKEFVDEVMQLPSDIPTGQSLYLKSMALYEKRQYVGMREVTKDGRNNHFTFITYADSFYISRALCSGLIILGVQPKDFICMYAENRPEWILTMDSCYLGGFVQVSLYDTFTPDLLTFTITNCTAKYIFVSKKNLPNFLKVEDSVFEQLKYVFLYDEPTNEQKEALKAKHINYVTYEALIKMGESQSFEYAKVEPEDLLYVCYSSGTTGVPKGVMLSNRSFITNLVAVCLEGKEETFTRHLCYLPLAHVFERMCSSSCLYYGGTIGVYSGDPRILTEDLMILKPTVFIAVPRVLARINDQINLKLSKKSKLIQGVFEVAYKVKRFCINAELPYGICDSLVFNQIKGMFGGCIEQCVIGSAAMPADMHERLQVILGFPIRSGFGLSEGGSGNTINPNKLNWVRFGTCGYPLRNIELMIDPVPEFETPGCGEILMGGTGLCSGYLFDDEATRNLFTDDTHKWIHTGDIGKFDEVNSLVVVDRMRSVFKLTQGEYVAADMLASTFEDSPLISQIFVYGDSSRSFLVAIVVPDRVEVAKLHGEKTISDEKFEEICKSKELCDTIQKELDQIAIDRKLLGYQKIHGVRCVHEPWTIENGFLSPTFKLKRRAVVAKYQYLIDELYNTK